jgi:signal transduction histidine kinase
MHDDIGSELSKIAITCEHLKKRFPTQADTINELDIIKGSTAAIVNNIGNIIWALNPINNTLDGLLGYLREYAFEYLEIHHLEVLFNLPQTTESRVISHEVRTHVFMVVKEALHNIIKHAAASVAEISIVIAQNKLVCFISDNGVGMSENKNSNFGNGLRNMKQRIAETGGNLMLYSEPGKGTKIEFKVPL